MNAHPIEKHRSITTGGCGHIIIIIVLAIMMTIKNDKLMVNNILKYYIKHHEG